MEPFKVKAKEILLKDYIDEHGRLQESYRFLTGNPHLHTGQGLILLHLNGLLTADDLTLFYRGYAKCRASSGLFSRHPDPYRFTDHYDVVSHDEYNGLIFSSACAIALNKPQYEVATEIVDYGKQNAYQYLDKFPGANFLKKLFKSPITAIKTAKKMLKTDEKNRETFDPDYQALAYTRQPRDVAFYKIISPRYSPGILSVLYFCLANIISVYRKRDYARGTSKILAIFRHEAIRIAGCEGLLIKLTRKIIYRKLRKEKGKEFLNYYMKLFFNADDSHPYHDLSKGLELK